MNNIHKHLNNIQELNEMRAHHIASNYDEEETVFYQLHRSYTNPDEYNPEEYNPDTTIITTATDLGFITTDEAQEIYELIEGNRQDMQDFVDGYNGH